MSLDGNRNDVDDVDGDGDDNGQYRPEAPRPLGAHPWPPDMRRDLRD
jgi:hypothetical protein